MKQGQNKKADVLGVCLVETLSKLCRDGLPKQAVSQSGSENEKGNGTLLPKRLIDCRPTPILNLKGMVIRRMGKVKPHDPHQ